MSYRPHFPFLAALLLWLPALAPAQAPQPAPGVAALLEAARARQSTILPVDRAFQLTATAIGPDAVRLHWQIADGDYLYRSRISVKSAGPVQLGTLQLPPGLSETDEYFGTQQIYFHELTGSLSVARAGAAATLTLPLSVRYQGCSKAAGICYPPTTKTLDVALPPVAGASGAAAAAAALPAAAPRSAINSGTAAEAGGAAAQADSAAAQAATATGAALNGAAGAGADSTTGFVSEQDRLATLIRGGNLLWVLASFFGLGLLLAFTPCVLPMVPILSGIIAGHGANVTTARAFVLSLIYVLGMAVTYTAAGVAVAAAGSHVQAMFQQPWIIVLFAGLFVVLALSMLGAFTLQMPVAIQTRLAGLSNRQTAGSFGGVAVMGALSALIVTTCVAPPLVATLAVIGQSGAIGRGAAALFAMSLGMGAPLLLVGASAGKLLPKAGPWMDTVKRLFGVMMLAVAAWMLARIVPARFALLLWAVPALVAAWLLWRGAAGFRRAPPLLGRLAAVAAAAYAAALLIGCGLGGTDPLSPLPLHGSTPELSFRTIKSVADLDRQVSQAHAGGRAVMLDFYADWCVSCKEMEKYTFTDPAVQATLQHVVLLRADVTRNDSDDQALLRHFGIFGPPTIAFYGSDGQERTRFRVVGYMKAAEFAALSRSAVATRGSGTPSGAS